MLLNSKILITVIFMAVISSFVPQGIISLSEEDNQKNVVAVDLMPEIVYQETPVYPDDAKKAGIEGEVFVASYVDKDGSVTKAKIKQTSGKPSLDKAALEAAYKYKFKPALKGEQPVATWVTYKVVFVLEDDAIPGVDEFIPVETMPEMTDMHQPEYPKELKDANVEAIVYIKAFVNKEGIVKKAVVSKPSGEELFDKSALEASYLNKYKPAMQNGQPIGVWVTYKVEFKLD